MMALRTVMSLAEVDEPTISNIAKACDIPKGLIEDVYSCTPLQLAMITEARAETLHFILSCGPTAEIDRLCQAIRQVVRMNSILRTRIVKCSLGVVQVLTREDHTTEHPSGDLEQYLDGDWTRHIGLGTALFRTAFVDRALVITIHHAIFDHTSCFIYLRDDLLAVYYGATPNPRPAFKQFVTHCANIDEAAARSFWASRFKGAPAIFPRVGAGVTPTPVERARRKIRLTQTGNRINYTHVAYYIEAAWAMTAATYMASDNVAYGYVLSGRSPILNGLESTLGPTVVEAPVQVNLQRNMTVDMLVKDSATRLRQLQMHPASQYGNAAIGAINESARIATGFQTLLNIIPAIPKNTEETGMKSAITSGGLKWRGGRPFALVLICKIQDDEILLEPRADLNILCDDQLHRILSQFEHLLQLLMEVPLHTKICELPLLNNHDRLEILSWNKVIPQPTENCLHELFRVQARAQPEAIAVEACDGNASYSRLDQMSDRLAYGLHRKGVSPGQPVAFIFEKSLWAIVALLGIMKAGGICIPIDKDDRDDRKASILSLTKANMILTSSTEHINSISLTSDVVVVGPNFAVEWPEPDNLKPTKVSSPSSPESLAYMIFPGSSTSTLQGVLLEHRSLASALMCNAQRLDWGSESRILQFASYSSSMSIMEIFGALLFGGCLCIPNSEACGPLSPNLKLKLPGFIASVKANWAMLPPSVLRTISPSQVPGLRWLASVGESIDAEASERWGTALRFFNCWGACGASTLNTVAELGPLCPYPEGNIGKSVGSAVWIVNSRDPHQLCPIGAVGELWIEGPGVARGHLKGEEAPTMTASFISATPRWAAELRNEKGARFYRTGDLGRYNPDGSISFVGRQANQVKIAGQKVQVEEVERALISCSEAEDVAVLARIYAGRTQLVAVLCLADTGSQTKMTEQQNPVRVSSGAVEQRLNAVRDYTMSRLPSHMVPATWLAVEQLPRRVSGKLDRASISTWLKTRPK
ncbi:putative aminoadipate-semialdehyde dehydrogenase [Nemania serpens]|nr:putative aminoadipate-semialdehyde dehydrogenase [Nemania serpens]